MWLKATVCVMLAVAIAMSLLALRQRRIDQMHHIAAHHREMRQARQNLWELQVHIANELKPATLKDAVQQAGLELEPVIPVRAVETADARGAGHGR